MNTRKNSNWIPEILYEEDSIIPFIEVPEKELDPSLLFIFINRKTGETEPDSEGNEIPIFDMELRQFADLSILAKKLSVEDYDKVRSALGLENRASAAKKGSEITKSIATKINAKTS